MNSKIRRALCGILICGALAGSAIAATPESGTVSAASPKVTWTGETIASYPSFFLIANTGDDTVPCEAPSCDSFALKVETSANLTIAADIGVPEDNPGAITLRITKPDGSVVVETAGADSVSEGKPFKVTIKNAPTGDYTIEYANNFGDGPITYNAYAELAVPGAGPAPGGPTGPTGPTDPNQPPAQEAIALEVKVGKASARKLAKARKLNAKVTVSREVDSITGTLKKGSKTVGRASLGKTSGTATLAVKLPKKKLKTGTYALTVVATAGSSSATKTVKVKVGK